MQTVTFSGLHCDSCVRLITKKLQSLSGMETITPQDPLGVFAISGSRPFTEREINAALKDLGYSLVSMQ